MTKMMIMMKTMTAVELALAIATGTRVFTSVRFEELDFSEETLACLLPFHPDCFAFSELSHQWRILPALEFVECDFSSCRIRHSCLSARFSSCNFLRAEFDSMTLLRCTYSGCDLARVHFNALSTIRETRFEQCTFVSAGLRGSWEDCLFFGCRIVMGQTNTSSSFSSRFIGGLLTGDFSGCHFSGSSFEGVDMRGIKLRRADIGTATFENVRLGGADLTETHFERAHFEDERYIIGHILLQDTYAHYEQTTDAVGGAVSEYELVRRRCLASYVQQNADACWMDFIQSFQADPSLLVWAYGVLRRYPSLHVRLRQYRTYGPAAIKDMEDRDVGATGERGMREHSPE